MPEASIVITAQDRYSDSIRKMAQQTRAFDKDVEALEEQLHQLNAQKVSLRVDLDEASRALKEAKKQFEDTGDAADGLKMQLLQENYDNVKRNFDVVTRAARDAERQLSKTGAAGRGAGEGVRSGINAMVHAVATSGIGDMLGNLALSAGTAVAGSMYGEAGGNIASSALQSAASGAAVGTMLGGFGVGTAVGALAGGGIGVLTGGLQNIENRDEAFKSYVQEAAEGQLEEMSSIRSSGSTTAGQREQDQIAFAQRFGSDEAARDYLDQVRAMAVNTNYTYDEITGYSKSLLNSYSADETLGVLQTLSDATAGLNLDSSGVSMFIAGLSRMRTTDKTTQEYLNYFSERGLDVYEALARSTGADKSQISEMVSDGAIGGVEAAQAILDYIQAEFGGLSEKLAGTYDAMVDNLGDAEANLNARMGEGYNQARKEGLEAQQAWLESEELGEAYEAIGAWQAELENSKEQFIRESVDAMMASQEYQSAQAAEDAAEMGRLIMQAKAQGMNEYNASEGAQEAQAAELALAEGIRSDTASNEAYWDAGYTKAQEYTKGLAAGIAESKVNETLGIDTSGMSEREIYLRERQARQGYATGLGRVPYDNFPALLHEGERVLTASEARAYDRGAGAGGGITIQMSGTVIREEADIDRVAQRLYEKLRAAGMAGVA